MTLFSPYSVGLESMNQNLDPKRIVEKNEKMAGPRGENMLQEWFNLAGACVPSSAINSNQNWPWKLNPSPEGSSEHVYNL